MRIPYVTITKSFPEMEGRSFEEIRDFIEQDPRTLLQDADITIDSNGESVSECTSRFTKRRDLVRRAHMEARKE